MKIFQFTPQLRINSDQTGSNKTGKSPVTTDKSPGVQDFAAVMAKAMPAVPPPSKGSGQTISVENQRASNIPPPNDLKEGATLLSTLNSNILGTTPEQLRNTHNLEALIYTYSPTRN